MQSGEAVVASPAIAELSDLSQRLCDVAPPAFRLENLFSRADVGVVIVDGDGYVLDATGEFLAIAEASSRRSVIGMCVDLFVPPDKREAHAENRRRAAGSVTEEDSAAMLPPAPVKMWTLLGNTVLVNLSILLLHGRSLGRDTVTSVVFVWKTTEQKEGAADDSRKF